MTFNQAAAVTVGVTFAGIALLIALSGCDLKPAPPCHLSLKDTPDLRHCVRECKLATYAADHYRTDRLNWCLRDLCGAAVVPDGCHSASEATDKTMEWR